MGGKRNESRKRVCVWLWAADPGQHRCGAAGPIPRPGLPATCPPGPADRRPGALRDAGHRGPRRAGVAALRRSRRAAAYPRRRRRCGCLGPRVIPSRRRWSRNLSRNRRRLLLRPWSLPGPAAGPRRRSNPSPKNYRPPRHHEKGHEKAVQVPASVPQYVTTDGWCAARKPDIGYAYEMLFSGQYVGWVEVTTKGGTGRATRAYPAAPARSSSSFDTWQAAAARRWPVPPVCLDMQHRRTRIHSATSLAQRRQPTL